MDDWKWGYHRALLEFIGLNDWFLIDPLTVETFPDHEPGYAYSEYTFEDPYTRMIVEWKSIETGRTEQHWLDAQELVNFLKSL